MTQLLLSILAGALFGLVFVTVVEKLLTRHLKKKLKGLHNGRSGKAGTNHSNTGAGKGARHRARGLASRITGRVTNGASEGAGEGTGVTTHEMPLQSIGALKVDEQIDTIIGYKSGDITVTPSGQYRLRGFRDTYGVEATAECKSYQATSGKRYCEVHGDPIWRKKFRAKCDCPTEHKSPGIDCQCGFYAVKDKRNFLVSPELEVELYGTVVAHERGYRAEKQRVLSVSIPTCSKCHIEPSTHVMFAESPRDYVDRILGKMGPGEYTTMDYVCDAHVDQLKSPTAGVAAIENAYGQARIRIEKVADLTAKLGTEVRSEVRK